MKSKKRKNNTLIGIYCIKNKISGKCYVGQSQNITMRWEQHLYSLRNEKGKPKLQSDWDLYGEENFEFVVLEETELNKNILDERESYWAYKLEVWDKGYNETKLLNYYCISKEEILERKIEILSFYSSNCSSTSIRFIDLRDKFNMTTEALAIVLKNIKEEEFERYGVYFKLRLSFSYENQDTYIDIITKEDFLKKEEMIRNLYLSM